MSTAARTAVHCSGPSPLGNAGDEVEHANRAIASPFTVQVTERLVYESVHDLQVCLSEALGNSYVFTCSVGTVSVLPDPGTIAAVARATAGDNERARNDPGGEELYAEARNIVLEGERINGLAQVLVVSRVDGDDARGLWRTSVGFEVGLSQ